ncbi:DUF4352 domain-containing protein [Blastococcus sp. SYSU D00820]
MVQNLQAPAEQPAPPQPTSKPFYKKAWFLALVAIVVIAIIATQTGKGGSDDSSAGSASGGSSESSSVGIGQPALDGKFQFVVNGVDCSATSLGDQYVSITAQGTFCIVDLTISNIGNEAQSFFGENATLRNAEGQEFSADTEASFYLPNSASLYEEINPGNTLNSKVIFDVPVGTTPASLELHDSAFSGGVTVALQ